MPSPTSFGALSPHQQQLDNPVSTPGCGLTVRLTGRSRQRGQHHAPTGSILGCLYQEFPHWNIDVDIVEFEIEGGRHVGRAYDARRGVVLPSHPPQLLAFGEGHLQPAVAARDGAFDRDFSGHFPNITTTAQGGGSGMRAERRTSSTFARRHIQPSPMIAVPVTQGQSQTHSSAMAGNSPVYSHRLEITPPYS